MKKVGLMKLSIVIPVYNVELYLEKCVNSIASSYDCTKDFEVILVDDGSTDGSSILCDKLADRYSFVRVIHQCNKGLSEARNTGIMNAVGEYIWFIDSDDYIKEKSIVDLINDLEFWPCDVTVCQSKVVYDNGEIIDERPYNIPKAIYGSQSYMDILREYPSSVMFCAQYHIVNRQFILKNHLFFKKDLIHEDELWTPQILVLAESINYTCLNIYFHYMRSNSIMNSLNLEKSAKHSLLITSELFNFLSNFPKRKFDYIKDRCVCIILQTVWKDPGVLKSSGINRMALVKNSYYFRTLAKSFVLLLSAKLYIALHRSYTESKK